MLVGMLTRRVTNEIRNCLMVMLDNANFTRLQSDSEIEQEAQRRQETQQR